MITFSTRHKLLRSVVLYLVVIACSCPALFAQVAQNHVSAGKRYMNQGKYPEAEKAFKAAIAADPSYVEAFSSLIELKSRQKDSRAIARVALEALKKNPVMDIADKGYFHRLAARAYLDLGMVAEAFDHIKKARGYLDQSEAVLTDYKVIEEKLKLHVAELFETGRQALEAQDYEKAISALSKALRVEPENREIYQKFKEARELRFKEIALKEALEIVDQAETLLDRENWEEALSLLESAEKQAAWSDEIKRRAKAGKQRYQKNLDQVKQREEQKRIAEEKKRQEAYYLERAKLFLMEEDWNKAIEFYSKVLESNPSNQEARQNLQEAQNAKKLRVSFEEGNRYMVEGDFKKAAEKFEFVYSKTPHSRTMLSKLCESLERLGRTEEAIGKYKDFIKENPKVVDLYVKIGDLYGNAKEHGKAVTMYNIHLGKYPKNVEIGTKVADAYMLMGDDKKALETYRKFSSLDANNLELREKMVQLYLNSGNTKRALEVLGELVEHSEIVAKDAEYLYQKGQIYLEKKAYRDALIQFKKCNNVLPGYKDVGKQIRDLKWQQFVPILIVIGAVILLPILKFILGFRLSITDLFKTDKKGKYLKKIKSYKDKGLWGKVISEYENLSKLPLGMSETRDMRQDLANAYLKLERYDEAISEAERLLSIDNNNRTALAVMGRSQLGKGELEKAITQCKIVFETDPENGPIHEVFQEVYRRSGRLNELLVEYEDMTTSFPDSMFLRNIYLKIEKEVNAAK